MHTDIPTRSDIESLIAVEAPGCISLYLPTSPLGSEDVPGPGPAAAILRHPA